MILIVTRGQKNQASFKYSPLSAAVTWKAVQPFVSRHFLQQLSASPAADGTDLGQLLGSPLSHPAPLQPPGPTSSQAEERGFC